MFFNLFKKKEKATEQKPSRSVIDIEKQILEQVKNMRKNGFKEYTYISNCDCCDACAKLNGKHFPISKLQVGVNAPPMHEGCRCAISPYSDRKEYEVWLKSK